MAVPESAPRWRSVFPLPLARPPRVGSTSKRSTTSGTLSSAESNFGLRSLRRRGRRPTIRFSGPGLALLAPAAERCVRRHRNCSAVNALQRTMMSTEEKLAIHEMIAQYSYMYDSKDADGYAQVFAENGEFEIFVPGKTGPVVRLQSRKEIHKWAAQRLQERRGRFTGRHYQSGIRFDELTSAEARVRVMMLVTRQEATDKRPYVNLTGVYHDVDLPRFGRHLGYAARVS